MSRSHLASLLVAALLIPGSALAGDACYSFEVINVDDNLPTSWFSVNDLGNATGNYCPVEACADFDVVGAVLDLSDGSIDTVPNVLMPEEFGFVAEYGLNNWGTAAGYAFDFTTGTGIAYTRRADGETTVIPDLDGDIDQQLAIGINDWGTVAGLSYYADRPPTSWTWHPWRGFRTIELSVGDAGGFAISDINNWGTVVGTVTHPDGDTQGVRKRLWRSANTFGPKGGFVLVGGTNDWGQVVGSEFDTDTFLATPWLYHPWSGLEWLEVPDGLTDLVLEGINNHGVVAGTGDGTFVGVIGTPCP